MYHGPVSKIAEWKVEGVCGVIPTYCGSQGGAALHYLDVVPCAVQGIFGVHSHLFERLSSLDPPKALSHPKT